MTRREAQRRIVGLVAEAAELREARRELSRRLRRLREEVAGLLPLARAGSGGKKDAPVVLADTGAKGNARNVHAAKMPQCAGLGKAGIGRGVE